MHNFRIEKRLENILTKLKRKNKQLFSQIKKKINEIISSENVESYKNLRYDLKEFKRVHIGHFVLVFRYDKEKNLISFDDFDHHDKIY